MAILRIIDASQKDIWNSNVKSFRNWDVYYLQEYALSFQIHGDGAPFLIDYRDDHARFCYVVMMSDIADDPKFKGALEHNRYFDWETPYGYGGPLSDGPVPESSQDRFLTELSEYAESKGIVSQFVRFHPLLMNHETAPRIFETRYLHDTVYIDTASPEIIMGNMDSKNRNMVRKAIKNGVAVERRPIEDYQSFLPIYRETMEKDNASEYFFFGEAYFKAQSCLKDNACLFYAQKDGQVIAAAIMYYNDRFMHYHLAGTLTDFRKYAPSNLMLYEAACWASSRGIKIFHLGGGMADDDNLFRFKKQFNKNGRLPFVIGRTVFDRSRFEGLTGLRKKLDSQFDENNNRMIRYRA